MRFRDRTALVTGAGSGIGRATAVRLAAEGARVLVTDVDPGSARTVAGEIGTNARPQALDVTREDHWDAAMSAVVESWGALDVLVANAGVSLAKPIDETSLEDWRRVQAVNCDGVFLGLRRAIEAMRRAGRGGSIVVVSSASAVRAAGGASAYCASKAAVRQLARAAALECAAERIRINVVSPGGVRTPLWELMPFFAALRAGAASDDEVWAQLAAATPMKRFAAPEEVAAAIAFLASDDASFVTGAELAVDGGYTA